MDNATAREFVIYSASLITLAKQMRDRLSVSDFLEVYSGDGRGQKKRVLNLMIDLGLVAVEARYDNGEPATVRWSRKLLPSI